MPSDKIYGIGLIGCGMVAPAHAKSVKEIANARLAGVFALERDQAEAFAEEYGAEQVFDDVDALVKDPSVDVVVICTPTGTHLDLARQAARAGKHVLTEKPIEVNLQRADELIRACDEAGVKYGVIFQSRFKKAARALKREVEKGVLGKLILGDAYVQWWRPQEYYDNSGWRGTWAMDGGGAVVNQSSHTLDLLLWLMGDVESVTAQMRTAAHDMEAEDLAVGMLTFKSGALGVLECATALYPGVPERVEIHGENGWVTYEGAVITKWETRDGTPAPADTEEPVGSGASDPMAFPHSWHRQQIEDFLAAIDEDREPVVNGPEGRKVLELIEAIYRSAKADGEKVILPLK